MFRHLQFNRFTALHRIERKLDALLERTRLMALDFTTFDAALATLRDEMGVVASDVQKVIDTLNAPDASSQAKVDAAAAALGTIQTQAAAIASAAEAAAVAAPGPQPATG